MRVPLIYKEAPQFGFDIGTHTVKVVQLKKSGRKTAVQGYGYAYFPREAVVEGIVVDPGEMAEAIRPLLKKPTHGSLTSKRVITGLPAAKLFTRTLKLPPMSDADLEQAIHYEVEQYVPVPVADLYIDYEVINVGTGKDSQIDVLMMAAPRAIVDSYIKLFDILNLELSAVESNMTAVVRALLHSGDAGSGSLVMDIGSISTDLTIYENYTPLTGSVPVGGEHYTDTLVKELGIKPDQATEIKIKFGIAKGAMKQSVANALKPQLDSVAKEAKRVIKYYQDRSDKQQKVQALVISGGTASMPGLADYFRTEIGLPLTIADPWKNIEVSHKAESTTEPPMYTTAIGLALRGLL